MTDTTDSTVRLLRLLTLLQQHAVWTGPELAERLDVSVRGVRRDVARLRELGYPVHSERGLGGGYRLAAGKAMPPLVLDDDEAVAVAVSLSLAAGGTVSGVEEDAARALAKLDQVVPARLRERIDAVRAATVRVGAGVTPVDAQVLTTLARACRDGVQVRFGYERAGAGSPHRESSASSAPEPTALAAPESSESSESSGSSGSGAPESSGSGAPEPSPSSAPEPRGSGAPESSAPGAAEPSASIEGRPGATGGAGRVEGPGARGADGRQAGEFTLDEALVDSFRFNLSRQIVGEVRGKEIWAMIKAMESGTGSISTTHARSARDTYNKLVTCCLEVPGVSEVYATRTIASAINYVAFIKKVNIAGKGERVKRVRRVTEIIAIELTADGVSFTDVFKDDGTGVARAHTVPPYVDDLIDAGFDYDSFVRERGIA